MAKALRANGFRFVGPTTAYALMQATGMVDDHLVDCAFRRPVTPGGRTVTPGG
jgi:DNA-3-methyladenine glycosylase I